MKDLMNYAVAKIRAREALLLDSNGYLRLSQARNANEFVKLLTEYGYGDDMPFDLILSNELSKTYSFLKEAVKNDDLLFPLLLRYDLFNMGVYMKAELSGNEEKQGLPFKPCGNYTPEALISALRDGKAGVMPDELLRLYNEAKEAFLNTGDISTAQIYLDKHGFSYILQGIKKIGSDFSKNYFMTFTDIKNLTFTLRLKRIKSDELIKTVLICGGYASEEKIIKAFNSSLSDLCEVFKKGLKAETVDNAFDAFSQDKTFAEINEILDENLNSLLDKTRLIPFGCDPVIAYALKKEAEIHKLRKLYYSLLAKKQ